MGRMTTPNDVLTFWFADRSHPERELHRDEWFDQDPEFDAEIERRFGSDVEAAIAGGFSEWEFSADGMLALILMLDQFTRNMHRSTARAFEGDRRALALAKAAIDKGFDQQVSPIERQFFYMPFEHSEDLTDQDKCCSLTATLKDPELSDYAERHRAIIRRFGRFPHRNHALGRISTSDEVEFLKTPGSSFW